MGSDLRAIVIGAGWAGEGHTKAMQSVGVEVSAICARQPELVRKVADSLGVEEASTDWKSTLDRIKPDIVCIGTPANLRLEVVEAATALGSHVLCDKPLATSGPEAGEIKRLVEGAGVKNAFASTHRYNPLYSWARELIDEDTIGIVKELAFTNRMNFPIAPWSWAMSLGMGGGFLNNGLAHGFGIAEKVTAGKISRAMGNTAIIYPKAPVVPGIHDFREWMKRIGTLTPEVTKNLEWREVDAEANYTALVGIETEDSSIYATFSAGHGYSESNESGSLCIYGETGTMIVGGRGNDGVRLIRPGDGPSEKLEVPERLKEALPDADDDVQRFWNALVRDFVADIRGEAHEPYLTFHDGFRYQTAFDAIRESPWTEIPA